MFKSINVAIKEYVKKPMVFGWTVLISIILNFITLGAMVGTFLIIYYLLSMFGLGGIPILLSIIAGILIILFFVLTSGFKGALIKTLLNVTKKEKPSIIYFFKYGLERGEVFFGISLVKAVILLILFVPLYLLYDNVLLPVGIPYLDWIAGFVIALVIFFVEIPFVFAYIAAAVDDTGVLTSIKSSLRLWKKKNVRAFGLYIIYALVWVTMLIPLLDILTVFVLYPFMYTALILFYIKNK